MAKSIFPYNPLLVGCEYSDNDNVLTIEMKQKNKPNQLRSYAEVPQQLAYRLIYMRRAGELMSFYANEIKGKFKVLAVTVKK